MADLLFTPGHRSPGGCGIPKASLVVEEPVTFTLRGSSGPARERDARLAKVGHSHRHGDRPSTATCWNLPPLLPAKAAASGVPGVGCMGKRLARCETPCPSRPLIYPQVSPWPWRTTPH